MRALAVALFLASFIQFASAAQPSDAALTITVGPQTHHFTVAELLERSDAATIKIPEDVSYRHAMTYHAVPLLNLLKGMPIDAFDTIEARATDGFASQIPMELVEKGAGGGSVAWVAVEDPAEPWPVLPGKDISAGPLYLVWEHPERSAVGSELWPYQLASLTGTESPAHRWPQMAVDDGLPADAPARRGQAVFTTHCMSCHRMKDAGASDIGPDLGQPMNPTQYLSPEALRLLIRNPKAVRTWPQQQMLGFDKTMLPEPELDALIAYLTYMAENPG